MKTFSIFFLIFSSTFCMDHDPKSSVLALKTLSAKHIANNFKRFEKEISNIPSDFKDLIELQVPLTKDNVWTIYAKTPYKQRKNECKQFLIEQYGYQIPINPFGIIKNHFLLTYEGNYYKDYYNEEYFCKKIKNDKRNIKTDSNFEKKLKKIAKKSTEKLNADVKYLDDKDGLTCTELFSSKNKVIKTLRNCIIMAVLCTVWSFIVFTAHDMSREGQLDSCYCG